MIYQLTSQFTRDSKNDVGLSRVSTCMNYLLKLWNSPPGWSLIISVLPLNVKAQDLCRIPFSSDILTCSNSVKGAGQKYIGCLILHVTWEWWNRRPDWQVTLPITPGNRWPCFQLSFALSRATWLHSITLQLTERKIGKQKHHELGSTIRIFGPVVHECACQYFYWLHK